MMKQTNTRGFTLIELLVVIAIIGILASVVLASLSTAREKGRAASVQSSMSSLRAQAELGVNTAGTYILDLCNVAGTTAGGLDTLLDSAESNGGTTRTCGQNTVVGTRPGAWGAAIQLPGTPTTYFCVDSTGYAGVSTVAPGTEIAGGYSSADVVCDNA